MTDNWWERALCAQTDPEIFFPEKGASSAAAKRTCNGYVKKDGTRVLPCPVKAECREYAVSHPERMDGIWGGTTERERRVLRRDWVRTRERRAS